MELNLERPLLFFDIESTGLNIASDGIIELSFVKALPGGETRIKTWKIKPWDYALRKQIHIAEEASKVNGVHDEDLTDCPKFIEVLPEVLEWLPEDRFMIETDAPYMLPYPRVKGEKRNDSSKLPRIAAKIAAIRGLTEAEVERISTENALRFFGLPRPEQ